MSFLDPRDTLIPKMPFSDFFELWGRVLRGQSQLDFGGPSISREDGGGAFGRGSSIDALPSAV